MKTIIEKTVSTIKYLENVKKRAERFAKIESEVCNHGWQFGEDKKPTPMSAVQDGFCYRCGINLPKNEK